MCLCVWVCVYMCACVCMKRGFWKTTYSFKSVLISHSDLKQMAQKKNMKALFFTCCSSWLGKRQRGNHRHFSALRVQASLGIKQHTKKKLHNICLICECMDPLVWGSDNAFSLTFQLWIISWHWLQKTLHTEIAYWRLQTVTNVISVVGIQYTFGK